MGLLLIAAYALLAVFGTVGLVCFILVLVEMFRREQTGLAIACIVLALCTGIGTLIAFVCGWINVRQWNLKKVMWCWTACWVVQLVLGAGVLVTVLSNLNQALEHANEVRSEHLQRMEQEAKDVELDIKIE